MDSWNLKKLFTFSEDIIEIFNDTAEIKQYIDNSGKNHEIKPNSILTFAKITKDYKIPNSDRLKLSDNSVEYSGFDNNLREIIAKYTDISRTEKVIGLKKFLEYHYEKTKQKREFVDFVKYFLKTKIWIAPDKRDNFIANDNFIDDWIEKKEKQFNIKKGLYISIPFLIVLILGIVFIDEYRAMIIGALIAIFSTQLTKLIENIFK